MNEKKPKDDFDSVSFFCGSVIALFLDFITNDITDREWKKIHDDLETLILRIKKSG